MANGELISSEYVVGLMEEYMNKSSKNIFLADGFPRNEENIQVFTKLLGQSVDVRCLLLIDANRDEMLKRLLYRASTAKVKRDDDNPETIAKRINLYYDTTYPIFKNVFEKNGGNIVRVEATQGTI